MTSSPHIYIVDDDAPVRRSLQTLLGVMGYTVQTFESAAEFLEFCTPGIRGCLLLDIQMPQMTGPELMEELIRRSIRLPTILMSAYADRQNPGYGLTVRDVALIEKPFATDNLLRVIDEQLASAA